MADERQELARSLPPNFPIDPGSNNYKILEPAGKGVARTDDDIEKIGDNATVQTADSIESLWELAKLVDLPPSSGESREQYRSRTISEFQLNTNRGTAEDLITSTAIILKVRPQTITYRDADEHGVAMLGLPRRGLVSLDISEEEFVEIVQKNSAAGYRVEAFQLGTFEYITPEDYDNEKHVFDFGYDGLDEDGNPHGEGGTYAGLLD